MRLIKSLLASYIEGNPQDILFAAIPESSANSNDRAAAAEYRDAIDEMVVALQRQWEGRKDSERPTADDVFHGYKQFKDAYQHTHNNKKRRILFNAFWNSFRPEFYDEGISKILWEKIEALEYPDFIFLKTVLEKTDPAKKTSIFGESAFEGGRGQWGGDQIPVRSSDAEAEYAERLSHQNLVEIEHSKTRGVLLVSWKGLAPKLKKFALDEFELYEEEKSPPES
ncbi:MAG: hypothetical protein KA385_06930 [Vicinamibacteria bacterium]|nr:hypothetical protein [Vicinamibacteria bacterium]